MEYLRLAIIPGIINKRLQRNVKIPINRLATKEIPNCLKPAKPVSKLPFFVLTTSIIKSARPRLNTPSRIIGPIKIADETEIIIAITTESPKKVKIFPLICYFAADFNSLLTISINNSIT